MQGASDVVCQSNPASSRLLARQLAVVDALEEAVALHIAAVQDTLQLHSSGRSCMTAAAGAADQGVSKQGIRGGEQAYQAQQENIAPCGNRRGGQGGGSVAGKRGREELPGIGRNGLAAKGAAAGGDGDDELQLLGGGGAADVMDEGGVAALLQEEWLACLVAQADLDLAVMHL